MKYAKHLSSAVVPKWFCAVPHQDTFKILMPLLWYLNFVIQCFTAIHRKEAEKAINLVSIFG